MQFGAPLLQRTTWTHSEAATRRLQECFWIVVFMLALALNLRIAHQQFRNTVRLTDLTPSEAIRFRAQLASFGISNYTLVIVSTITGLMQYVLTLALSIILLLKRKGTDWFAYYIALTFVAGLGAVYPPELRGLVDGQRGWVAIGIVLTTLNITSLFLLPMLFPNGRFAPRWMAVVAIAYLAMAVSYISAPASTRVGGLGPTFEAGTDLLLLTLILGSLIYRYRRRSDAVQRQQMKWGAVGVAVALPAFVIGDAAMRNIDGSLIGILSMFLFTIAVPIFTLAFPLCLTVAILRFHLWNIDLYINRTLVWLCMTALVVAAYVGVVLGLESLFPKGHSTALPLIVLGLTAVLFEPVRHRVQKGVNRLVYGDRDDPYRVVRKLADDLSETVQPVDALRTTVRTLAQALRLPYAAISLESGVSPIVIAGTPGTTRLIVPLVYQSQPVGELIVSPRTGSHEFDAADRAVLEELARQIGVVAHNVQLTNDLQTSRERIVTAREEERRRLRRDLHDGLGAHLAALSLHAGALKTTIRSAPGDAEELAFALQHELQIAIADIRQLVNGLRPAALDDLGLIGALQTRIASIESGHSASADQGSLSVSLDAPANAGPLPAAVEAAIYRIVDEALTNVVRHAKAARCLIRIVRTESEIHLTIEDNGIGIAPNRISGVGLQSMRERALELGGSFAIEAMSPSGTRIVATLPIGAISNDHA